MDKDKVEEEELAIRLQIPNQGQHFHLEQKLWSKN